MFITDFADEAVVLPLAATVLVALVLLGWRRGALAWGASVAGVLGFMLLLKVVTFACGWELAWTDLTSPSGHTAASAVVYGGLLALFAPRSWAGTAAAAGCGGLVALLFGLTRLALEVHTVSDVLVGAVVGVTGAIAMRRLAGPRPPRLAAPRLALAALAVMLVFHGNRLQAETRIRWAAIQIWPLTMCRADAAVPGLGPSRETAWTGAASPHI